MTSQVAITLLKSLEQSLDSYCELNDEGKTAFNMAISALELFGNSEQLPSTHSKLEKNSQKLENKNGELISREEVLKLPQRKGYAVNGWETYIRVSDIKELSPVQSEQELLKDGTLVVKTDFDMTKFDRVNVIQNGTHYGDLFYQDDDTRRTGKWIWDDDIFDLEKEYICSECRCYALKKDRNQIRSNFCPNCGADMRGKI